ncbi:MAG: type I-B CRISPR-associated protein Cas7/Csh2 [Ignavibacteriaceae bacterium]|nr:MAG: type I-B CRISPR-associated protein Cas7/Csh2 [Ignavibacteriaceae bacterium]
MINNKTELLFLYDIENANPNGDPLNENRPRFDSETNTALVSDVRLKRTIRDYWYEYEGFNGEGDKDIFVRETFYQDEKDPLKSFVKDGKRRAKDFNEEKNDILNRCIDIRVFGGVIPLDKNSITFTGPVQFQMGRSLNSVEVITEQGTGAFASKVDAKQDTFRTEYKLPYAVIGFNGIINDKAAKISLMTEDDKNLLYKGMWEGTKNLITRSKFGQNPLLFLAITFNGSFYLGRLRQKLNLIPKEKEDSIRSVKDYKLDLTDLIDALKKVKDKVLNIEIRVDPDLKTIYNGNDVILKEGKSESVDAIFPA